MKTFLWKMNMGAAADVSHRTSRNQFGDGYAQLYKIGINNKTKKWSGSKTGDYLTVIKPIIDFLDEHEGYKPFYWTDPEGHRALYICTSYPYNQRKGNSWQITLNFEQYHSV